MLLAVFLRNIIKKHLDYSRLRRIIKDTTDQYIFLVDEQFRVKETNYYALRPSMDHQPNVLGNVLHCRTGCDSGLCGTGIACKTCPVRTVLKNSFQQRRDFTNIMATMHLYNEQNEVEKTNVNVDGKLVYVNYHPMFLVQVSAAETEQEK